MAPTSNSTKAAQQNQTRSATRMPVVPAIPLIYAQHRRKKPVDPPAEKAKEETPAPAVLTPVSSPPALTSPSVNSPENSNVGKIQEILKPEPAVVSTIPVENVPFESDIVATEVSSLTSKEDTPEEPGSAETRTSPSRSTYHMPPPFDPASHNHQNSTTSESTNMQLQPTMNGYSTMHNANPSAGSLMFGGYSDSNTSSPAPPTSAGNVPPYPYQQQGNLGRHGTHPSIGGHHPHPSNGFMPMDPRAPPVYPARPDSFVNPGMDGFAHRPMMTFGPPGNYSPSATPFGVDGQRLPSYDPSTPHSFHGSQSSTTNEQEPNGGAFYGQYPTAFVSNGSNGHIDDVRLYQVPRPNRTDSQPVAPPTPSYPPPAMAQSPMPLQDNLDGLLLYLQNQFANASYADYTLELRYSDDHAPPVRIPGHGILFARSPELKGLIDAQACEPESDVPASKTLLIETNDRFLRSDSFWMAVQRLYGGPLLDLGVVTNPSSPIPVPGSPSDRFDLALGYTAAGKILEMPPVINRGVDIASHFISWDTIEKALDFALEGGVDSSWTPGGYSVNDVPGRSIYGPPANALIYHALAFISINFPVGFEIDTNFEAPATNRRLPTLPNERAAASHLRIRSIRFGDHPAPDTSTAAGSIGTTLSKILLNLPFSLLKYSLELQRLGSIFGWATPTLRLKVMSAIIEEREKRRIKVRNCRDVPNGERTKHAAQWNAVGWEETISPPQDGIRNFTGLKRTWVNFLLPESA